MHFFSNKMSYLRYTQFVLIRKLLLYFTFRYMQSSFLFAPAYTSVVQQKTKTMTLIYTIWSAYLYILIVML